MKKSLTKPQFAEKFADRIHTTTAEAKRYLDDILDIMQNALMKGERIEIRGFGSLFTRNRKPRKVVTPNSGTTFTEEKVIPRFRASQELINKLNGESNENASD